GIDVHSLTDDTTFRSVSPFGRVPVLMTADTPLTESIAIVEYLEEVIPEPPLMPQDPRGRARVREICEGINSSVHPMQNSSALRAIRPDWTKEETRLFRSRWIASNLEKLKPLLWRSSSYAAENQFTLADIFIA